MEDWNEDTSHLIEIGSMPEEVRITLEDLYINLEFLQNRRNDPRSDKAVVEAAIAKTLRLIETFSPPQKTKK